MLRPPDTNYVLLGQLSDVTFQTVGEIIDVSPQSNQQFPSGAFSKSAAGRQTKWCKMSK